MRRRQEPLLSVETILWLQTTCGNRAVQRLLARKAMERDLEQQRLEKKSETKGLRRCWQALVQWLRF